MTMAAPLSRPNVEIMHIGAEVPDFELPDQKGAPRRLSTLLADGPVVLFFYPGALTSGCTVEACHFRDLAAEYHAAGVQRVGISLDTVDKQKEFADANSFDYPLLSDTEGTVAESFGVRRGRVAGKLGLPLKRRTFAIGQDRRLVAEISGEMSFDRHADEALAALS